MWVNTATRPGVIDDLTSGGERVSNLGVTTRLLILPGADGVTPAPDGAIMNPVEPTHCVPVTGVRNMNQCVNSVTLTSVPDVALVNMARVRIDHPPRAVLQPHLLVFGG